MKTRRFLTTALFLLVVMRWGFSQTAAEAYAHPAIAAHYSLADLQELEQADTNKLKAVIYYYTASFTVEPVECVDCIPFDSASFDVSKFEKLRQQDTLYTRTFTKYGFKLTLVPVSEMEYQIPLYAEPPSETSPE